LASVKGHIKEKRPIRPGRGSQSDVQGRKRKAKTGKGGIVPVGGKREVVPGETQVRCGSLKNLRGGQRFIDVREVCLKKARGNGGGGGEIKGVVLAKIQGRL